MTNTNERKLAGALVGLAVGDAVGTTLEFTMHNPNGYGLTDMVGGGPFMLPVGAWTDDTSMALCLGESLLGVFDPRDQLERYVRWAYYGVNSSIGTCFDIGGTCRAALVRYKATGETEVPLSEQGEGNGSLMRLAPVALRYHADVGIMDYAAQAQSYATHGGPAAAEACRIWAQLIVAAAQDGATKETVRAALEAAYPTDDRLWAIIEHRTYETKTAEEIRGSGYVVEAFEAALWAFYGTDSFDAAVLAAANLGQDADTTAAICGQIAGAFYGLDGIRRDWLDKLVQGARIERLAFDLIAAGK